jgi:N-methylhydantoinase A/oxoprolinase/acetone carboxylase beta subunit
VRRLEDELRALDVRTGVHLMTSASGVATAQGAIERPVNLLMSGPVAGVVGGIWVGRQAGFDSVITLDVGGTSADIGLAQNGALRMKHLLDTRVGPYQAMIPMVDVDTIGAGGGSIAYVDGGGIFRSGPRSAGALPGPAAYGRGGTEPTATDAMVNLGWLLAEDFLGGAMSLRADLAREAFKGVAGELGMSVEEASMGAIQIASSSMVQSIEENSVRKGYDPRDFALVAEGGAGPLFAAAIAAEVGTPTVIVPPFPGVTAAMGLLATDAVYEFVATTYQRVSQLDAGALGTRFEELEGPGDGAAVRRRHPGRPPGRPASGRLPLSRAGLRAAHRLPVRADRRRVDREGHRPTSTTRTSASTRAGSTSRTSRSRTSGSAASGSCRAQHARDRLGGRVAGGRPAATSGTRGSAWTACSARSRRSTTPARR